jgi:hypothetical protein
MNRNLSLIVAAAAAAALLAPAGAMAMAPGASVANPGATAKTVTQQVRYDDRDGRRSGGHRGRESRRSDDHRGGNTWGRTNFRGAFHWRFGRRYDQCGYWRYECADRWGRWGWGFNRCMLRHGC